VEAIPAASLSRSPSPNSDGNEELTEPQPPTYRNKRAMRRAPPRSKKSSDDWRWLGKPPVWLANSNKLSLDLKLDTALDDIHDEPIIGAVNGDTEGMDIDADMDEVNDVEKNPDLEAEEDEAEEEVSQQDEETQPIEGPGEGDCGS
jgi:hypothetical protein